MKVQLPPRLNTTAGGAPDEPPQGGSTEQILIPKSPGSPYKTPPTGICYSSTKIQNMFQTGKLYDSQLQELSQKEEINWDTILAENKTALEGLKIYIGDNKQQHRFN